MDVVKRVYVGFSVTLAVAAVGGWVYFAFVNVKA